MVRDIEFNGERNRGMYIMKSRGMKHSNQVREFVINDNGLELVDVFLGPDGILTGSARESRQLIEKTEDAMRAFSLSRKDREIERKSIMLEAKISGLRNEFESVKDELNRIYQEEELKKEVLNQNRDNMISLRKEKVQPNTKK